MYIDIYTYIHTKKVKGSKKKKEQEAAEGWSDIGAMYVSEKNTGRCQNVYV